MVVEYLLLAELSRLEVALTILHDWWGRVASIILQKKKEKNGHCSQNIRWSKRKTTQGECMYLVKLISLFFLYLESN